MTLAIKCMNEETCLYISIFGTIGTGIFADICS